MLGDHDDDGDDGGDGDHLQHHPGQSSQTQVQSVRSFPWQVSSCPAIIIIIITSMISGDHDDLDEGDGHTKST